MVSLLLSATIFFATAVVAAAFWLDRPNQATWRLLYPWGRWSLLALAIWLLLFGAVLASGKTFSAATCVFLTFFFYSGALVPIALAIAQGVWTATHSPGPVTPQQIVSLTACKVIGGLTVLHGIYSFAFVLPYRESAQPVAELDRAPVGVREQASPSSAPLETWVSESALPLGTANTRVAESTATLERVRLIANRMQDLSQRFKAQQLITNRSTDLNKLEAAYSSMAELTFQEAAALRELPNYGIDRDLVDWQLRKASLYRRSGVNFASLGRVITQTKTLAKYYSSERALLESFVRGANGDPFGTTRDVLAKQHELQAEWDRLMREQSDLAREEADLMADGDTLAARLRERYEPRIGR